MPSTPTRCPWCLSSEVMMRYHDEEWAVPVHDDRKLFEFIVLDCPPGLSGLVECVFEATDALVVPTVPSALSLRTLAALHRHVKPQRKRGLVVLPFFSMVERRKAQHRRVREYARTHALGFLDAEIPFSGQIENAAARREPLTAAAAPSEAATAFEVLAREVEDRLAGRAERPKLERGKLEDLVLGLHRAPRTGTNGRGTNGTGWPGNERR